MSASYVRWVSWHVLGRVDAAGWYTLCGRLAPVDTRTVAGEIPEGEKSCESCLRRLVVDRTYAAEQDPQP